LPASENQSFWSGLRGRLLLAFAGISGFALLAAATGFYALVRSGDSLEEITKRKVPVAIAALSLAQGSERIVGAGPSLSNATDPGDLRTVEIMVTDELDRARGLLSELRKANLERTTVVQIGDSLDSLSTNLTAINAAARRRLAATDRKLALLHTASAAYLQFGEVWAPRFKELQGQLIELQRSMTSATVPAEQRMAAVNKLDEAMYAFQPLTEIQRTSADVFELLVRSANATLESDLPAREERTGKLMNRIDALVSGLDFELSTLLLPTIQRLHSTAAGNNSLFAARHAELAALAEERKLIAENSKLSTSLSSAVADLVAKSRSEMTTAAVGAARVQSIGQEVLTGTVVVSLLSSILIVWLYVGRNIVNRLGSLSAAMIAIAGGRRNVVAATSGKDEIASMGRAVEVFRRNAIELDQLLADRSQEAARLEKVVRERTAELQVTFDNMENGVLMFDGGSRLAAWNRQVLALLDLPETFVVAKPHFGDFIRLLAESGEYGVVDVEAEVKRFLRRSGDAYTSERTRPDGRILAIRHQPIQEGGFVVIYSDVTERRRYEEALGAARDQAEEMSRTKSTFLANMSHELRTPLNAIIGYSELLQEEVADKGETSPVGDLQRIESAGRHLLGLINNLLDLSKIEAGKMDVFIEDVDLRMLVDEALSIIKPLADKNGNTIEVICPADIGSFRSDQTKVKQVLLNLLSNASKFTSKGTLTLALAREAGSRISFRVSDTGVGMTQEQLGRLFEAFSQADASTTKRFGGTGLGLAITQHFCAILGGDVKVESTLGAGSTFTITLPDARDVPVAPEPVAPETAAADGRATVLVVDDDPTVHTLLAKTLGKEGYRVISALSGSEALALARKHKPQAITLDVLMPKMDGWAALKEFKADAGLRDIPVIMVSNLNERGLAMPLGAADYMTKPVDKQRLAAILREHCSDPGSATILVVEDDPPTRDVLCRLLQNMGYACHATVNGRSGLDWLVEHAAPSLILLDLMMPEMDGFEFLRELRRRPAFVGVPVIVVTAKQLTEQDIQLLTGETERIIVKDGAYLSQLSAALRERLDRRSVEPVAD
jgi:signal transduction histidine kinase/DNA-binding response OmpR family regulator